MWFHLQKLQYLFYFLYIVILLDFQEMVDTARIEQHGDANVTDAPNDTVAITNNSNSSTGIIIYL